MKQEPADPFELTRQLIELNGLEAAKEIARKNCWRGVLAQCLALEPALVEAEQREKALIDH